MLIPDQFNSEKVPPVAISIDHQLITEIFEASAVKDPPIVRLAQEATFKIHQLTTEKVAPGLTEKLPSISSHPPMSTISVPISVQTVYVTDSKRVPFITPVSPLSGNIPFVPLQEESSYQELASDRAPKQM